MKKFFKIIKRLIKFAVIAIVILLALSLIVTRCNGCKKDKTSTSSITTARAEMVAYSETLNDNISVYSNGTLYFNYSFNNDVATLPYLHVEGVDVIPSAYNWLCSILLTELPKVRFTIEVIQMVNPDDVYWGVYIDGTMHTLHTNYYTFDTLPSSDYFNIRIITNSTVGITFNTYIYFYAGEYVPGFAQGVQAGIEQANQTVNKDSASYIAGVADGAAIAQYGIFQNATVDAEFEYANFDGVTPSEYTKTVTNLIPSYISNAINTNPIWTKYETDIYNSTIYTLETATITINLKTPFTYSNSQPMLISGPSVSLVDSIIFTDINNKKYTGQFKYNATGSNYSEVSQDTVLTMSPIKSIELYFGRASDTLANVSIIQDNGNFYGGYTSGYDKGLTEGVNQGYSQAVAEGVSQMGLFNGALAFIKVFFQLTTQFLETKIAGDITLGLLIIGLPAAFMIVNLAIGLVKKLLGGRGASEGTEDS